LREEGEPVGVAGDEAAGFIATTPSPRSLAARTAAARNGKFIAL